MWCAKAQSSSAAGLGIAALSELNNGSSYRAAILLLILYSLRRGWWWG